MEGGDGGGGACEVFGEHGWSSGRKEKGDDAVEEEDGKA
jgi:hypothetical protein